MIGRETERRDKGGKMCHLYLKKKILLPSTESYYTKRTLWFFFLKESTASLVQHLCPFFQIIRMESNSRERLEG